jgi:hypothetical protein
MSSSTPHPTATLASPSARATAGQLAAATLPLLAAPGAAGFAHERLDVHAVLVAAYQAVMGWSGVAFSRGSTGDQLKRALSSALCRYAEGYYAQGGNQSSLWAGARASCGEAATAVLVLALERRISAEQAAQAREPLGRAMRMLSRLGRR